MLIKPDMAEVISPELAAHILDKHNNRNRAFRESRKEDYATALAEDEWMTNGETVTFDWEAVDCGLADCVFGNLVDGQNRCQGIVASGVAMETFIVIGLDPEVRATVGGAVGRHFYDDLTIMNVSEANHKAGLMRAALIWDRNHGLAQLGPRGRVSRVAMRRAWPKYVKSIEEAAPAKRFAVGVPLSTGGAAFFWWLMRHHKSDPAIIERFFLIFADGSQDLGDRCIVRLRKHLDTPHYNTRTSRPIRVPKQHEVWLLILAWNEWLDPGEKPVSYRRPDKLTDPFPKPVTAKKPVSYRRPDKLTDPFPKPVTAKKP